MAKLASLLTYHEETFSASLHFFAQKRTKIILLKQPSNEKQCDPFLMSLSLIEAYFATDCKANRIHTKNHKELMKIDSCFNTPDKGTRGHSSEEGEYEITERR